MNGIPCRTCGEICEGVCDPGRYCRRGAHVMRMAGLVWRCDRGHERPRDGAEEMRQAGIEPML